MRIKNEQDGFLSFKEASLKLTVHLDLDHLSLISIALEDIS